MLLADFATFLKSEMLFKVDRMTMANALEARVPLLDHELVELAFSIPVEQLRQGEQGKMPLRQLVEEKLPAIARRRKTGFLTPFSVYQSGEQILVESPSLRACLNPHPVMPITDEARFFDGLLRNGLKALDPAGQPALA
jgi:asparagine synthetase B (glutamine-hydrolysing)